MPSWCSEAGSFLLKLVMDHAPIWLKNQQRQGGNDEAAPSAAPCLDLWSLSMNCKCPLCFGEQRSGSVQSSPDKA